MGRWGGAKTMLTLFQNGVSSLPSGKYQYIDVALHSTQPLEGNVYRVHLIVLSKARYYWPSNFHLPHTDHQKTPLQGKTNILYIFPLMICGGQSPKWNLAESFANKSHLALSKLWRGVMVVHSIHSTLSAITSRLKHENLNGRLVFRITDPTAASQATVNSSSIREIWYLHLGIHSIVGKIALK